MGREARGAWRSAAAAVAEREATARGVLDAAEAEVERARRAVLAAGERVAWAEQARETSEAVVALERRRFEVGGGDLFALLAREANLAAAQRSAVDAATELRLAEASWRAAVAAR
ncbi:MAG: TolC family protein [Myxococcota bacterium]